mmetsp:Transcript_5942/g.14428  ORF Transcript_5942/g.14428 Transcript_5942/m.14428 type:complete len:227 (+) Transcript_5942:186-866(+)
MFLRTGCCKSLKKVQQTHQFKEISSKGLAWRTLLSSQVQEVLLLGFNQDRIKEDSVLIPLRHTRKSVFSMAIRSAWSLRSSVFAMKISVSSMKRSVISGKHGARKRPVSVKGGRGTVCGMTASAPSTRRQTTASTSTTLRRAPARTPRSRTPMSSPASTLLRCAMTGRTSASPARLSASSTTRTISASTRAAPTTGSASSTRASARSTGTSVSSMSPSATATSAGA